MSKEPEAPKSRPASFEARQHGWETDDRREIERAIDRAVRGTLGQLPLPQPATTGLTGSGSQ